MSHKVKLSAEEKLTLVRKILKQKRSCRSVAKKIGISRYTIRDWIRNYQSMGSRAFIRSGNKHWSADEKLSAVRDYLNGGGSLCDVCMRYKIPAQSMLRVWIRKYNSHENLESKGSHGGRVMTNGRKTTYDERIDIVKQCIEGGYNYAEIADKNRVSYQQVYSWVRKYQKGGVTALIDRRGKRKDESSMTELDKLRAENRILKAEAKHKQMEIDFLKKLEEIERRWG